MTADGLGRFVTYVYGVLDWQHALVQLPPAVVVTAFDRNGTGSSLRATFHVHGAMISTHVQTRDLKAQRFMYLVYAGPPVYSWDDPPDGLAVFVRIDATPGAVVRDVAAAAIQLAKTKCHAAAGHPPAIERGPFGELCPACWKAMRAFLDVDTDPLPF